MLNLRTARMLGRKQRLSHVVFCLCWKWWATNHDMYCCPDCTSSSTHWHLSTPFTTLKSSLRSAVSVSQLFWYSNCNDTCMSFHTCAFVAVLRHVNKMATIEGLRPTSLHQNYPTTTTNKAYDYRDAALLVDRVGGVLEVENYSVVVSFFCPRK